jgi:hypothetical protein
MEPAICMLPVSPNKWIFLLAETVGVLSTFGPRPIATDLDTLLTVSLEAITTDWNALAMSEVELIVVARCPETVLLALVIAEAPEPDTEQLAEESVLARVLVQVTD